MAQTRWWNFQDDDKSEDLVQWWNGIKGAGRYAGFDAVLGAGLTLNLNHATTGEEWPGPDDSQTLTGNLGLFITKQGMFISDDATPALAISAGDPTNPRIDLVVAEHAIDDDLVGGVAAIYLVIEGTPGASPVAPSLTSPSKQIILGELYVPANTANLNDAGVEYTQAAIPTWPQNAPYAMLDTDNIFTGLNQFGELALTEGTGEFTGVDGVEIIIPDDAFIIDIDTGANEEDVTTITSSHYPRVVLLKPTADTIFCNTAEWDWPGGQRRTEILTNSLVLVNLKASNDFEVLGFYNAGKEMATDLHIEMDEARSFKPGTMGNLAGITGTSLVLTSGNILIHTESDSVVIDDCGGIGTDYFEGQIVEVTIHNDSGSRKELVLQSANNLATPFGMDTSIAWDTVFRLQLFAGDVWKLIDYVPGNYIEVEDWGDTDTNLDVLGVTSWTFSSDVLRWRMNGAVMEFKYTAVLNIVGGPGNELNLQLPIAAGVAMRHSVNMTAGSGEMADAMRIIRTLSTGGDVRMAATVPADASSVLYMQGEVEFYVT